MCPALLSGLIGAKEVPQGERIRFINRLCDALNVRFEDTQYGSVKATSIANFNMWPIEESELDGFGDDDIGVLVNQLKCSLPQAETIQAEWPLIRAAIFEVFSKKMATLTWQ